MDYYNNETILTQAMEIESLRQQLASVAKERDEIAAQARMLDRMVDERDEQLAAALAACEVKQAALQEIIDLMSESYGLTGFHLNGDVAPWSEVEEGGRFERLTSLNAALAIQPDASALKQHDEALIERCAEVCMRKEIPFDIDIWLNSTKKEMTARTAFALAAAIRELKETTWKS